MAGLGRQALIVSLSRFANYGLMLITPLFLVRLLHVEQFGEYREFLLYSSLLQVLAVFSLHESLLYFVPAHGSSPWRVVRQTTVLVGVASTFVLTAVCLVEAVAGGRMLGQHVGPLVLYVFLFTNVDFWEYFFLARGRTASAFAYTSMRLAGRTIMVLLAAYLTRDVDTILWCLIALEAVRLLISLGGWRLADKSRSEPPIHGVWREQIRFCLPAGLAACLSLGNRYLGNLAVVHTLGPAALAGYTIGMYAEPVVLALRNSIGVVILPEMVRRSESSTTEALDLWRRATVVNAVLMFPLATLVACMSAPLILRVFGEAYASAVPVMQIFALVMAREALDFAPPLRAMNKTRPLAASHVIGLVANAAALAVLMPRLQLTGAVSALVIASLVSALYLYMQVAASFEIRRRDVLAWSALGKVALATLVPAVPVAAFVGSKDPSLPAAAAAAAAYASAYVGLLLWLDVEEARLLLKRVRTRVR